jgi:hypothetical protein
MLDIYGVLFFEYIQIHKSFKIKKNAPDKSYRSAFSTNQTNLYVIYAL